ncbi:histidine phosphatase superfamily [Bombardia bombarda]|uniref:Histidine phosphatase superfamily n=1 Tax=Bombardia bombarda TaxID=252184 RepID=A0AA39XAY1_9PEZI|nr:histidine phosphatase superfamily [Bombardia bombarda]
MSLEVIYVTRHGFRSNWLVDPSNGNYTAMLRSPTGIAADPELTAHGVEQARELGDRLLAADPPVERVYSSPYYRCLQTIEPFVRKAQAAHASVEEGNRQDEEDAGPQAVRLETGLGEWFGSAPFEHPVPAAPELLNRFFPTMLDEQYSPIVVPTRMGESIEELHDRVATAMDALIADCDRDGVRSVLLCSHAAVIIALGRVLTGNMPVNIEAEDFRAFTCGLTVYQRRKAATGADTSARSTGRDAAAASTEAPLSAKAAVDNGKRETSHSAVVVAAAEVTDVAGKETIATTDAHNADRQIKNDPPRKLVWRAGRGVSGGWDCLLDSDCAHLSGGEERGWRFSGDESFKGADEKSNLDAGISLGVVVEGRNKGSPGAGGPRL